MSPSLCTHADPWWRRACRPLVSLVPSCNRQPRTPAARSTDVLRRTHLDRTLVPRETAGASPCNIPEALWNRTGLFPATDKTRLMRPAASASARVGEGRTTSVADHGRASRSSRVSPPADCRLRAAIARSAVREEGRANAPALLFPNDTVSSSGT